MNSNQFSPVHRIFYCSWKATVMAANNYLLLVCYHLAVSVLSSTDCCPTKCVCGPPYPHLRIKCRGLQSIPDGIPINTFQLFVETSDFNFIPSGAFSRLRSLRRLGIYNSSVADIPPDAFVGLEGLTDLSIKKCKLKNFPKPSNMGNLTRLILQHNAISSFDQESLSGLRNLEILNLNNNKLKYFKINCVILQKLKKLMLNKNTLTSLSLGIALGEPNLEHVNVCDNLGQLNEYFSSLSACGWREQMKLYAENNATVEVSNHRYFDLLRLSFDNCLSIHNESTIEGTDWSNLLSSKGLILKRCKIKDISIFPRLETLQVNWNHISIITIPP